MYICMCKDCGQRFAAPDFVRIDDLLGDWEAHRICPHCKSANWIEIAEIILTNNDKKAIIDAKHYEEAKKYTWWLKRVAKNNYYVATTLPNKKTLYLHQLITKPEKGMEVHHDNEDVFDNREENLIVMTSIEHKALHRERRKNKNKDKEFF